MTADMLPPPMSRLAASVTLIALAVALVGAPSAAATSVAAKYQLRGHLPELGEKPALRVFQTNAAYDAYRASLGDANVFPAASSMFMSFDKDILALYVRGNDSGGRCFATTTGANLDGDAVTLDLAWQNGTCGAPITAHYPFILLSLSRTAADGSSWITPTRSVCGAAPGVFDSRACATLSGASPAPTVSASASPPAATTGAAPTATPSSAATPTLTPSAPATSPVAAASPTPGSTSAQASAVPSRSPAAAASPASTGADAGTNYLLYGMLIAIGVLIGIALMLSRSSARRGR